MKKKFISYKNSCDILENISIDRLPTQKLYLSESLGYILAKDIVADHNLPDFNTSAMDGYAIRYEDQKDKKIKIIDKNPAGSIVNSEVVNGVSIKTFTGSLMPKGSDTLIPIENVTVEGEYIIINEEVKKGFSVRKIGESYKKGDILIQKGTLIDFAQIGVMAGLNIVQVEVYRKPVVAIASTGSEILDIGQIQTNNAQIRSSNHLTIEAIAKKYGASTIQLGVVKDDIDSITDMFKNGLSQADIIVTTGGVSVGDYDFVKDVIKERLECEVLFQGVMIKPGQHILCAKKDDKYILALPGFAYSSTVTALLYLLPILFKFKGSNESLKIVKAICDEDFPKKAKPKTSFVACNLSYKDGSYHIDFKDKKDGTSAILTNLLGNTALLIQDEFSDDIKKGDLVDIIIL